MATEEEAVYNLLVTLKGIGFEKEEVEDKVKEIIHLNLPFTNLRLRKDFGHETIFIDLQLTGNPSTHSQVIDKRKVGLHFIEKEKEGLGSGVIVILSIPYLVTEYNFAAVTDHFAHTATSSSI